MHYAVSRPEVFTIALYCFVILISHLGSFKSESCIHIQLIQHNTNTNVTVQLSGIYLV